jgi:Icc-related predicted phosphoesterase
MKLLLVADLHYALRQFDWILREATNYDLVVLAGDVLDIAGYLDLDVQIVVILKYLDQIRRKRPLIVSSGNHDADVKDASEELVADWLQKARCDGLHVDGDSFKFGDDLITVCPWWDGEAGRCAMEQTLAAQSKIPRSRWLWVHHSPPDQSPVSWTGKKFGGDTFLRDLIGRYSPDFVLCGHIHNSPFVQGGSWMDKVGRTWVFNPGKQIGPQPAFITLDLEAMTASYLSLAGSEVADLKAASHTAI